MFVKSVQCARRPAEGIVFQEPELQVFVLSWICVLGCLSSPFIYPFFILYVWCYCAWNPGLCIR